MKYVSNTENMSAPNKHQPQLALILLCLSAVFAAPSVFAAAPKNVFILHSYSQEYDWTKRQHEGFVSILNQDPVNTPTISTEYLDTKRLAYNEDYAKTFDGILAQKYSHYHPDLIYVSDDNAMQFALSYLQTRFPQTPIFFSGINDFTVINKIDKKLVTGTFEKKDIATNLGLIKQLALPYHKVILLGDNSSTDKAIAQEARGALLQYEQFSTQIFSFEQFEQILTAVKQNPDALIVLTTIGGWKDEQGQAIAPAKSIHLLAQLQQPIIAMEDGYIFDGVIGGYVTSGSSQGSYTGQMARAYLNGTAVVNMPPILTSPNEFILDVKSLNALHIDLPNELSQQAILLHPQPSFYEREKQLIISSIYGLIALLLVGSMIALRILSCNNKQLQLA